MAQTTVEQELITEKNKYCSHLFTHQKKYLFLLALFVLSAPFIMNRCSRAEKVIITLLQQSKKVISI